MKTRNILVPLSFFASLSTLTSFASLTSSQDNKQLLKAAKEGNSKEVERLLIEAGTYKDQVDIYGTTDDTPLSYALNGLLEDERRDEFSKIIRMLLLTGHEKLTLTPKSLDLLQKSYFYQDTFNYTFTRSKQLLKEQSATVCSFVLNNELPSVLVTIIREYYEDLKLRIFVVTHLEFLNESLLEATHYGNTGEVERLLHVGAYKNVQDKDGWTPLHLAAREGHSNVVDLLIKSGADKNAVDKRVCWTPLHLAARHGHEEVIEILLRAGADKAVVVKGGLWGGWTPLHLAAENGHGIVVELLLKAGVDKNAVTTSGLTPLHLAARPGHEDVIKILLKAGADKAAVVKGRLWSGWTPLHWAASNGHGAVVAILLREGADKAVVDKNGLTPLHVAAFNGHGAVVEMLLRAGADKNTVDENGKIPLTLAQDAGHKTIAKILIKASATE